MLRTACLGDPFQQATAAAHRKMANYKAMVTQDNRQCCTTGQGTAQHRQYRANKPSAKLLLSLLPP